MRCPTTGTMARSLLIGGFFGSLLQRWFVGRAPLHEILYKSPVNTASSHIDIHLLTYAGRSVAQPLLVQCLAVLGAQCGLLLLLYSGSRVAAACRTERLVVAKTATRWAEVQASELVEPFGRNPWSVVLDHADWQELCVIRACCRTLCVEARVGARWRALWLQHFGTECTDGAEEIGLSFLMNIWELRQCARCGETFCFAHSSAASSGCRIHPGVCVQVHFYPSVWLFSCCGGLSGSEGCRRIGRHVDAAPHTVKSLPQ